MPSVAEQYREATEYAAGKVYALEDRTVQLLYEQYRQAYQRMLEALSFAWQRVNGDTWDTTQQEALRIVLQQIRLEMDALEGEALGLYLRQIADGYRAGYYGAAYSLDVSVMATLNRQARFTLLPAEIVRAQAAAPYLGQTFVERYRDNRAQFELDIRRALLQSQIQGEGMAAAQRRIRDTLGIVTDRRLKANRLAHRANFNRTQMIARTEIMRASNAGALAVYQRNTDVLRAWEWMATLDERTCPICAPLDGHLYSIADNEPLDGGPDTPQGPPPAHPQCRCTVLPKLVDREIEEAIVGRRVTFTEWAQQRGLTENQYGQAFGLRGKPAPQLKRAS